MTHVEDPYEPGDDREPEPCEWYPAPEPVDLEEVEAAHEQALIEFDESGAVGEENTELVLRHMLPNLIAELREARQRIAEWEALEKREEWALSVRSSPDSAPDSSAYVFSDGDTAERHARECQARLWRRMLSVHPWEQISSEAPF